MAITKQSEVAHRERATPHCNDAKEGKDYAQAACDLPCCFAEHLQSTSANLR